jgi:uncharacterized protein (DUF1697 family)
MPRYVALLRGVSPMYLKMADLKACMEAQGFTDVRTILASGNVAFDARATGEAALEKRIEKALEARVGRRFPTLIRTSAALQRLVQTDPYAAHRLPREAKRVVTFLSVPFRGRLALPVELDGARVLAVAGREVFAAYTPSPNGPVFMTLIERTLGKDVTTRTWDTVRRCAVA